MVFNESNLISIKGVIRCRRRSNKEAEREETCQLEFRIQNIESRRVNRSHGWGGTVAAPKWRAEVVLPGRTVHLSALKFA